MFQVPKQIERLPKLFLGLHLHALPGCLASTNCRCQFHPQGCKGWIRTTVDDFRDRCPTTRRPCNFEWVLSLFITSGRPVRAGEDNYSFPILAGLIQIGLYLPMLHPCLRIPIRFIDRTHYVKGSGTLNIRLIPSGLRLPISSKGRGRTCTGDFKDRWPTISLPLNENDESVTEPNPCVSQTVRWKDLLGCSHHHILQSFESYLLHLARN